jgi:hypothetical protein
VPQEAVGRPGQIGDLGDELRLDPMGLATEQAASQGGLSAVA